MEDAASFGVEAEEPPVDEDEVRRRAYELSLEHPETSAEENWLEAQSDLMAKIQQAVFTHP